MKSLIYLLFLWANLSFAAQSELDPFTRDYLRFMGRETIPFSALTNGEAHHDDLKKFIKVLEDGKESTREIVLTSGRGGFHELVKGKDGVERLFIDRGLLEKVKNKDQLGFILMQTLNREPHDIFDTFVRAQDDGLEEIIQMRAYDVVEADARVLFQKMKKHGLDVDEVPRALDFLSNVGDPGASHRKSLIEKEITLYKRGGFGGDQVSTPISYNLDEVQESLKSSEFKAWRENRAAEVMNSPLDLTKLDVEYFGKLDQLNPNENPLFTSLARPGEISLPYSEGRFRRLKISQLIGDGLSDLEFEKLDIETQRNFSEKMLKLYQESFGDAPPPTDFAEIQKRKGLLGVKSGPSWAYNSRDLLSYEIDNKRDLETIEKLEGQKVGKSAQELASLEREIDSYRKKIQKREKKLDILFDPYPEKEWIKSTLRDVAHNKVDINVITEEGMKDINAIDAITSKPFKEFDDKVAAIKSQLLRDGLEQIPLTFDNYSSQLLEYLNKEYGKERVIQYLNEGVPKILESWDWDIISDGEKENAYKRLSNLHHQLKAYESPATSKVGTLMIRHSPDLHKLRDLTNIGKRHSKNLLESRNQVDDIKAYLARLEELQNKALNEANGPKEKLKVLDEWVVDQTKIDYLLGLEEGAPPQTVHEAYINSSKNTLDRMKEVISEEVFPHLSPELKARYADSLILVKYPYLANADVEDYQKALSDFQKMMKNDGIAQKLKHSLSLDDFVEVFKRGSISPQSTLSALAYYRDAIGVGGARRYLQGSSEVREHLINSIIDSSTFPPEDFDFISRLTKAPVTAQNIDGELIKKAAQRFLDEKYKAIRKGTRQPEAIKKTYLEFYRTFGEGLFNEDHIDMAHQDLLKLKISDLGMEDIQTTKAYQAFRSEAKRRGFTIPDNIHEKFKNRFFGQDVDGILEEGPKGMAQRFEETAVFYEGDKEGFIVSDTDAKEIRLEALDELWDNREKPEVRRILLKPEIIESIPSQGKKHKIAKWQLEEKFGLDRFYQNHKEGKGQPSNKNNVRTRVKEVGAFVERQFPELSIDRNFIFEEVEKKLMTNSEESRFLDGKRVNEGNWREAFLKKGMSSFQRDIMMDGTNMDIIDSLDYIQGKRKSFPTVIKDITKNPYHASKVRSHLNYLRHQYRDASVLARSHFIQSMFNYKSDLMEDQAVRNRLIEDILGDNKKEPLIRGLFEAYFDELDESQRKTILAYIISSQEPGPNTKGVPLKKVLEAMGPMGIKAGQVLRSSGKLSSTLQSQLDEFFDQALPPLRSEVLERVEDLFPEARVRELAGSGSVNFGAVVEVGDSSGKKLMLIRFQKKNLLGQIENEDEHWKKVIKRLEGSDNPDLKSLGNAIEEVRGEVMASLGPNGVELNQSIERASFDEANRSYQNPGDAYTGYKVEAARVIDDYQKRIPKDLQDHVSVFEYVPNSDWDSLEPGLRKKLASQVVETELKAIFEKGSFDPDGHKGNWLVDTKDKRLVRIDYAQMTTFRPDQRERVSKAFKNILLPNYDNRAIKQFTSEIESLFTITPKVENFNEVVKSILTNKALPAMEDPVARTLFIRGEIENALKAQGLRDVSVRMSPDFRQVISALGRINGYKEYIGEVEFKSLMAKHLPISKSSIARVELKRNPIKFIGTCLRSGLLKN